MIGRRTSNSLGMGVAALLAGALTACSSGGSTSDSAASLNAASAADAKGKVTVCGPTDASGVYGDTVAALNKTYPSLHVRYVPLGTAATDQLQQITQRMQSKSTQCDIVRTDVIWTAQLAAQGYLANMTDLVGAVKGKLIASTAQTARYKGKYYAMPFYTNAHLMYYRTDKVKSAPKSWQDVRTTGEKSSADRWLYQGLPGETLTISFLDLLYSAGGQVTDAHNKVVVNSPKTVEVLKYMQTGLDKGASPKSVLTYDEDATRLAYEAGNGAYMTNYPYAYAAGQKSSNAGKFDIAPLPAFGRDGAGHGVLGGSNLAVSTYSKNKGGAVKVLQFMTSEKWQERIAAKHALAPVAKAAYEAPSVTSALPFAPKLLTAVTAAKARPVSPVYSRISTAISDQVTAVLSGKTSPAEAAKAMARNIEKAQETF
ncbi:MULTISPECIES: ABC transporter substrate-binding protein [Streptomyces]|uniref:ABC transporter substrate-binding protein n=1 Tax=Streptomyces lycopersici TaxID=2974589 RepID=UPI0021D0EBCD|nr:ABC transporter substrate-binding protein [Streptomyces sp. NEAU-383]